MVFCYVDLSRLIQTHKKKFTEAQLKTNRPQGWNFKNVVQDFPGGAVVKNPPANAGDTCSIPGPARSHMPWSN